MHNIIEIDASRKTPKYLQIVNGVTQSIKKGTLKKGDKIYSINEMSNEFFLSRDTVQKAYDMLEEKGYIIPIRGKGFYINRTDVATPYRILLLFNKMSNYKKQVYNSFVKEMGNKATIDLKIYHSDTRMFLSILQTYQREYDYFVIMPHFYEDAEEAYRLINTIPPDKLIVLDKDLPHSRATYSAVFQDFKNDIIEALEQGMDLLRRYNKLILVFPPVTGTPYPYEIVIGFRSFCMQYEIPYATIPELNAKTDVKAGEAYIVIEESDLVNLIKICRDKKLKIGKQVGIISYNDTALKEILLDGITVISTDHAAMGSMAAALILENNKQKIKNNFQMIIRKSL
ncbi:MAG TPA: GntR family transcriptional regulator [Chitinophagaceae bacterium]|nr:GntR family transcriptional regulator [Chitinophagaceae bacterium]